MLIARSRRGYQSLSRLLTECHLGEPRLFPLGAWERLERHREDLLCVTGDGGPLNRLLYERRHDDARRTLDRLVGIFGREAVFVEIERSLLPRAARG